MTSLSEQLFSEVAWNQRLTDVDRRTQPSFFWAVYPPIFFLMGVVFHAYHVVLLKRKRWTGENVFVSFAFLAVVDCIALATALLHFWLRVNFKVNVRAMSVGSCRFHLWLSRLTQDVPPWVLVLMSYEKRAFLWYPVPANSQFSRSTVKLALLGLLLLFTVRNLDIVSYQLVSQTETGTGSAGNGSTPASTEKLECALPDTASAVFLRLFTPWMNFFFQGLGPFVCLVVYNAFVVRKIRMERCCAQRLMQKVGITAPFWLSVGLAEARYAVHRTAALTLVMFMLELPYSLYDISQSLNPQSTFHYTWQLLGTLLFFVNYAWLYPFFTLQDHCLLVTLRDTWRGPLVKKRGTNVASVTPTLVPQPQSRLSVLARFLRTHKLPQRLNPFSWRREAGVVPAKPYSLAASSSRTRR